MPDDKKYVILPQITVMKNNTKLIEAIDELEEAHSADGSEPYAGIHTKYSRIRFHLKDYSNKDKPVDVFFKVEPELIAYFLDCRHVIAAAKYSDIKVHRGTKYDDGTVRVVKLRIERDKKMRNPWKITVENGRGKAVQSKNGTTEAEDYRVDKTAKEDGEITFYMTDKQYYLFMHKIQRFIAVWEIAYGCNIIRKGREMEADRLDELRKQRRAEAEADAA